MKNIEIPSRRSSNQSLPSPPKYITPPRQSNRKSIDVSNIMLKDSINKDELNESPILSSSPSKVLDSPQFDDESDDDDENISIKKITPKKITPKKPSPKKKSSPKKSPNKTDSAISKKNISLHFDDEVDDIDDDDNIIINTSNKKNISDISIKNVSYHTPPKKIIKKKNISFEEEEDNNDSDTESDSSDKDEDYSYTTPNISKNSTIESILDDSIKENIDDSRMSIIKSASNCGLKVINENGSI